MAPAAASSSVNASSSAHPRISRFSAVPGWHVDEHGDGQDQAAAAAAADQPEQQPDRQAEGQGEQRRARRPP